MVFRVNDPEKASRVLVRNQIRPIAQDDLGSLFGEE